MPFKVMPERNIPACPIIPESLNVGITVEEIIKCEYDALLKAPIALMFMPQLKTYGFYDDNFKQ